MKRIAEIGRFVRARRRLCEGTHTIPQIAVLHSEHHLRACVTGPHLRRFADVKPVQGAVFSLLECHYGVDILDEWALRGLAGRDPRAFMNFPSLLRPSAIRRLADGACPSGLCASRRQAYRVGCGGL